MKKTKNKLHSLRATLLSAFFLLALICFTVGLYNYLAIHMLLEDMTEFIDSDSYLSTIQAEMKDLHDSLEDYLFTADSGLLAGFNLHYHSLETASDKLLENIVYNDYGIQLKNIGLYLKLYLSNASLLMDQKSAEDYESYIPQYRTVGNQYRVITENIQAVLIYDLQSNAIQYNETRDEIERTTTISYSLFAAAVIIMVVFIFTVSKEVTGPIERLSEYTQYIADGKYDIKLNNEEICYEISHLYDTFAIMVEKTQLYMENLEEKNVIENELNKERIRGLEMDNLLQQSQLQALHAQINPHFIFNTINIGAQLALIEGDMRTRSYLENLALVFRYNLEGLGSSTLSAELEHVEAYMALLTIRFGHKLRYTQIIDSCVDTQHFIIPRMSLQPLMENAFIHGISPQEDGGEITIEVKAGNGCALVIISNTGESFPQEKIDDLALPYFHNDSGHASGIGLRNVIMRLKLFLQTESPLSIVSENGLTTVTLTIPNNKLH